MLNQIGYESRVDCLSLMHLVSLLAQFMSQRYIPSSKGLNYKA